MEQSFKWWPSIHEWLCEQKQDAIVLLWLGIFAEEEWKGHPSNIELAEEYYLKAAKNGQTSAYKRLASMFQYGLNDDSMDSEEHEQCVEKGIKYNKKAMEIGDTSLSKKINSLYKYLGFWQGTLQVSKIN